MAPSMPRSMQATLDVALTVGAAFTFTTALAFMAWCMFVARNAHRIHPEGGIIGKTMPLSPRSCKDVAGDASLSHGHHQPTSVHVKYTRDTLPIARSYVVYTIELMYPSHSKVVLEKRYSEFDHLAMEVKKHARALHVDVHVSLPPKTLLYNSSESFLEHRRHGLQEFLRHLTRHPVLSQLVCVREFCRLD
ncbi:hypothetical protein DYB28_009643 [Aphanomyces astaci]|uniref:PX domain-containing protein n=1 Tax=Aphanomyces astaci TaxID=112090 RepID=A0A397FPN3_APHAT|nr:hypothetical protein AaE_001231 [Aphanomyces astaci]RHY23607.1 hypothetical protein DYB36_012288 [Aphanomyces astaci]RHY66582.1 hypothetical protein DYB38_005321 [Aphanomyces astaci]RHZ32349.1 hypothetical protein DYB31_015374 [Aphanomyces astaci]RHZ39091.1 hypothetical protein DYB26_012289 [Aphanomyces astaci]